MKKRMINWLVLSALIFLTFGGCGVCIRWLSREPEPHTARVTSLWSGRQVRIWTDTTEVIKAYRMRIGYNWLEVDSSTFSRFQIGDTLTQAGIRAFSHGQEIGVIWKIGYPAKIEE